MSFTLQDIENGIREVTGNPTENELKTADIFDLINKFYRFVLPDDLKPFNLLVDYKFNTLENQVTYNFDLETYVSLEPEFFCNGMRLLYYQNRSLWLRDYQYQYVMVGGAIGNGATSNYSGFCTQFPIVPGTFSIADTLESFFDNGDGICSLSDVRHLRSVAIVVFRSRSPRRPALIVFSLRLEARASIRMDTVCSA